MECIKNRNSWSMKKQPAKRSPVYAVIWSIYGLLGSFSWVHTLTPKFKTCVLHPILDPDFVHCNQQANSNLQHWEQTLEPSSAHLGSLYPGLPEWPSPTNCTILIPLPGHKWDPTAECPAASHGVHRQDKEQTSWYFITLSYFLNTDLLEMHHMVTFWNPFSHDGHTVWPINCLHKDMHF